MAAHGYETAYYLFERLEPLRVSTVMLGEEEVPPRTRVPVAPIHMRAPRACAMRPNAPSIRTRRPCGACLPTAAPTRPTQRQTKAAAASIRAGIAALVDKGMELDVHVFYCSHTGGDTTATGGVPHFWLVATPAAGGKGNALEFVRRRVGAAASVPACRAGRRPAPFLRRRFLLARDHPPPPPQAGRTLAAGDSGNDAPMFALPGVRGVVVGNAKDELRDFAREHSGGSGGLEEGRHIFARGNYAAAIEEGMRAMGVF